MRRPTGAAKTTERTGDDAEAEAAGTSLRRRAGRGSRWSTARRTAVASATLAVALSLGAGSGVAGAAISTSASGINAPVHAPGQKPVASRPLVTLGVLNDDDVFVRTRSGEAITVAATPKTQAVRVGVITISGSGHSSAEPNSQ